MGLESKNLRFRQFSPSDAELVEEWLNGWEGLTRFRKHMLVWNLEDVVRHFDDTRTFVILEREQQTAVGLARLGEHDQVNQRVDLEIHIAPEWRSRGLSSEVGIVLLHYCFAYLNVEKVLVRTLETNEHAAAAARKHGFSREGVLRKHVRRGGRRLDVLVWGLLEEEYGSSAELARLRAAFLPEEVLDFYKDGR